MSDATATAQAAAKTPNATIAPNTATAGSAGTPGPYLFGRDFSLVAVGADSKGLDLSGLHFQFAVHQWEQATPNSADIRIFNVSKQTALRFDKEFTRIILSAGYPGQYGVIFDGNIVQSRRGRASPVDTYLDITAADGDQAHNFAVVNTTLAAGATPTDIHAALCTAMNPHGVTPGYTADLTGPALPRGRVLYGMARDHLRDLADATDTVWSIQNGKVVMAPRTGYQPGEAVVLTSQTGMIGLPQQTQDGILIRCLLNPLLRVNNRVKIDNASIQQARVPVLAQPVDPNAQVVKNPAGLLLPTTDADGVYRILAIDYTGDSRGNDWYCDLACAALDGTVPLGQAGRGRGGTAAPVDPLAAPAPAAPTPAPPAATPYVAPLVGPGHA